MIPLRDVNRTLRTPYVNLMLIGINVLVFVYELHLMGQSGVAFENFLTDWGLVHARLLTEHSQHDFVTLITSMFLHGGYAHIIFNMWFLYVFGDNVEDRLGHLGYLFLYLLCGIGGNFADFLVDPYRRIPGIGASGAISGVLGAYIVLFPGAKIVTFNPFGWLGVLLSRKFLIQVPAFLFLGYFFLLQVFEGYMSLDRLAEMADSGGTAFWAHIGGFAFGMIVFFLPRDAEDELLQSVEDAEAKGRKVLIPESNVPAGFWVFMLFIAAGLFGTVAYNVSILGQKLAVHPSLKPRIEITAVRPYSELSEAIAKNTQIKGASSAYSFERPTGDALWLFNDVTVIASGKRRKGVKFHIANLPAFVSIPSAKLSIHSFLRSGKAQGEPFLRPIEKRVSYKLLDGGALLGKVYLFALRVKQAEKAGMPVVLDGTDLIVITNPEAVPSAWKYTRKSLARGSQSLIPGVSCKLESKYIYIYNAVPVSDKQPSVYRLVLSRAPWFDVARSDFSSLQYFCRHGEHTSMPSWVGKPLDLVSMFDYSGLAMTVNHVKGIAGFFALSAAPDGSNVLLRHSRLLEGPWSEPIVVPGLLGRLPHAKIINAQSHPELADDQQLAITYAQQAVRQPADSVAMPKDLQLQCLRINLGIITAVHTH